MTDDNQPIATRILDLHDGGQVVVELFAPTPDGEVGDDFKCGYKISGLGDEKVRFAYRIDPMQALLLALQSVAAHLYASEASKAGELTWLGMRNLGLPVAETIAHLVPKD